MSQIATAPVTPDAFLVWERGERERHHYVRGEVFAMAGGSARHSYLSAQMIGLLRQGMPRGPCNVHTSDLRLAVANDHFVYADAVVVCRPLAFRAGTNDVLINPVVVVEVLSKSTEAYDRGDKLAGTSRSHPFSTSRSSRSARAAWRPTRARRTAAFVSRSLAKARPSASSGSASRSTWTTSTPMLSSFP